jgi:hypothetical protein
MNFIHKKNNPLHRCYSRAFCFVDQHQINPLKSKIMNRKTISRKGLESHRNSLKSRSKGGLLFALILGTGASLLSVEQAQAQARLRFSGGIFMNLDGGSATDPIYLVLDNPNDNAISGSGQINSE